MCARSVHARTMAHAPNSSTFSSRVWKWSAWNVPSARKATCASSATTATSVRQVLRCQLLPCQPARGVSAMTTSTRTRSATATRNQALRRVCAAFTTQRAQIVSVVCHSTGAMLCRRGNATRAIASRSDPTWTMRARAT